MTRIENILKQIEQLELLLQTRVLESKIQFIKETVESSMIASVECEKKVC